MLPEGTSLTQRAVLLLLDLLPTRASQLRTLALTEGSCVPSSFWGKGSLLLENQQQDQMWGNLVRALADTARLQRAFSLWRILLYTECHNVTFLSWTNMGLKTAEHSESPSMTSKLHFQDSLWQVSTSSNQIPTAHCWTREHEAHSRDMETNPRQTLRLDRRKDRAWEHCVSGHPGPGCRTAAQRLPIPYRWAAAESKAAQTWGHNDRICTTVLIAQWN